MKFFHASVIPSSPMLWQVTRAAAVLAAVTSLLGCSMPNSSNPTLSISSAQVKGDRASLDMVLENPSDMDVVVRSIDWTLQYGPLPTARGRWKLNKELPSKGTFAFSRKILFDTPAMDPGADTVELSGTLHVDTVGNSSDMALNGAGFVAQATVSH